MTGDVYIKSLTKNFIKSKRRLNHTISHIKAERKRYQQESIAEAVNRRKDERTKSQEATGITAKGCEQTHFEFFQELTRKAMEEQEANLHTHDGENPQMDKLKSYIQKTLDSKNANEISEHISKSMKLQYTLPPEYMERE